MFEKELSKLVDGVAGGLSTLIMGFDGILLERYPPVAQDPVDLETIGMEYSVVLSQIRNTAELIEAGKLGEVVIRNEKISTLFRILTDEYFLVLAMEPGGNFGKGRYLMRLISPDLEKELV